MFKKIAVLVAALAVSAPAFADRGHHRGHYHGGHGHRHVVNHYHVKHVRHRPVVHHYHHYRPAPRPVYVVHRPDPVVPLLVGAVIGAAIVHSATVSYGY